MFLALSPAKLAKLFKSRLLRMISNTEQKNMLSNYVKLRYQERRQNSFDKPGDLSRLVKKNYVLYLLKH